MRLEFRMVYVSPEWRRPFNIEKVGSIADLERLFLAQGWDRSMLESPPEYTDDPPDDIVVLTAALLTPPRSRQKPTKSPLKVPHSLALRELYDWQLELLNAEIQFLREESIEHRALVDAHAFRLAKARSSKSAPGTITSG
jgi:hypothetical protein